MNTSSLIADFKGHEDQGMIADSEMKPHQSYNVDIFSGELVIQRSINVLEVDVILVGSEINWLSPYTAISVNLRCRTKDSSLQDKTEGEYGILINNYQQN